MIEAQNLAVPAIFNHPSNGLWTRFSEHFLVVREAHCVDMPAMDIARRVHHAPRLTDELRQVLRAGVLVGFDLPLFVFGVDRALDFKQRMIA